MSIEKCEIPVAEMEIEGVETEYAIAPDGTVGEANQIKQDMPDFQEKMQ